MKRCTYLMIAGLLVVTGVANAALHLELVQPLRQDIPPDGSPWHELAPNFCVIHDQENYEDNGDGHVSACDFVTFGGQRYHVTWAGPTYYLIDHATGEEWYAEPTIPDPGQNPTCEIWFEVYPNTGDEWHVDDWADNGDGVLSPCDHVWIRGIQYHVHDIGLNITVEPGSPVEETTWGKMKSFFRGLVD